MRTPMASKIAKPTIMPMYSQSRLFFNGVSPWVRSAGKPLRDGQMVHLLYYFVLEMSTAA
jgi:hypothetical protein